MKKHKKNVGADASVRPNNKGITLIALIITIIVMLILVAVTITVAINGGLFNYASRAGKETQNAIDKEQELASGRIKIGDTWYNSFEDFLAGKPASSYLKLSQNDLLLTIGGESKTLTATLVINGEEVKDLDWGPKEEEIEEATEQEEETEQGPISVILTEIGPNKINVIKAVREITGLGLTDAKALVESAPTTVISDITQEQAEGYKSQLETAGATATIEGGGTVTNGSGTAGNVKVSVILVDYESSNRSKVLSAVRSITGLSLSEAKTLIDGPLPATVISDVTQEEAENYKAQLETAGAIAEIDDGTEKHFIVANKRIVDSEINNNKITLSAKGEGYTIITARYIYNEEIFEDTCIVGIGSLAETFFALPIYNANLLNSSTHTLTENCRYGLAVIPQGFGIVAGCEAIDKGLVISDEFDSNGNSIGNEFVWIPVPEANMKVATTSDSYVGAKNYAEPEELTATDENTSFVCDSQDELDYYYGENYFTYEADFAYGTHYSEMVTSVNKYGGFYIGRYETTIDSSNNIGSKASTPVLTANKKISGIDKYYRWWGLYYAQRHTDVPGNGNTVQTNMIWGQQWDKMITYFNRNSIGYAAIDLINIYDQQQTDMAVSGQTKYKPKTGITDVEEINDKIFNIYDLRMNAYDWTAETYTNSIRVERGDCYMSNSNTKPADSRTSYYYSSAPYNNSSYYGTRLTLYIK